MKAIVLFIVLLLNSSIYAQTQEVQLKSNDWYVYKVVLNNQTYYPLNNVENQNTVNLFYYQNGIVVVFCGEICGSDATGFSFIDDDEFILNLQACYGTGCTNYDNYEFYDYYWLFWVNDNINHYLYEINQINSSTKELIITRDNGNKAYFYSTYLSSPSYVLEKVKVYPNPVQSVLNIELPTADYQNVLIDIYDVTGKKLKSFKESWQENINLNMESLPAGNYLLELKLPNEPGRGHFVKIIKE